jgi:hypothetical protein
LHRKSFFAIIVTVASVLLLTTYGCSRPAPVDEGYDLDDKEEKISFDLNDPKIRERLGEDDGYAFAILYGADTHGSLETCG